LTSVNHTCVKRSNDQNLLKYLRCIRVFKTLIILSFVSIYLQWQSSSRYSFFGSWSEIWFQFTPVLTSISYINRALNILFFLNNFGRRHIWLVRASTSLQLTHIDMILNDMLIVDNIIFFPMYNKFIYTVIYYNNFKEFGLETY
jgi:hypothetical protein